MISGKSVVLRPLGLALVFVLLISTMIAGLPHLTPGDPWLLLRLADRGDGVIAPAWNVGRVAGIFLFSLLFGIGARWPLRSPSSVAASLLLTCLATSVALGLALPEVSSMIGDPLVREITPEKTFLYQKWATFPGGVWGRCAVAVFVLAAAGAILSPANERRRSTG